MCAWQQATNVCGKSNMLTPHTTASSMRNLLKVAAAVSAATSEDEHAVSMVALGPLKPKT
jgi:hypothetical protein